VLWRILILQKLSLKIWYILSLAFVRCAKILMLMLLYSIAYATVGMTFLSGEMDLEEKGHGTYIVKFMNWEHIVHTLFMLWQCWLGEAYMEQQWHGKDAFNNNFVGKSYEHWNFNLGIWYIVFYYFTLNMLIANMLYGLLLDLFDEVNKCENIEDYEDTIGDSIEDEDLRLSLSHM